jgi:prepilin-type processing-associated H-X9-DG protein
MLRAPSNVKAFGDGFRRSRRPVWDGLFLDDAMIAPVASVTSTGWKMPVKKQRSFLNHRRRANRVFADGHLESEDMRQTFLPTDFEFCRWNIDNESLPDLALDYDRN